ncbi:putative ribonuclease H-like domain-containing protein [Tanacetum coccineum]
MISWRCKKQTVVANSTTEAEYIDASNCCAQVLWIQNQLLDYGYNFMQTKIHIDNKSTICIVKNPVFHSKTKHIKIRHHFIRDSNEKKLIQMIKIYTNQNVADLLIKAFDVSRFQYLIKVIITESTIKRDLQLEDAECLPTATIFKELTRMWYEKLTQKLTFYKAFFSPQWKFLIHTIFQCLSAKTTSWNEFSSTMASAIISLATNQKFNFSKYIFDNMIKNLEGGVKFIMYSRFVQVFLDKQVEGMSKHKKIYVTPSHTKKVFANMKRQGKDFFGRDTPLFPTMIVQAQEQVGECSEIPTDSYHTPTTTQPSTSKPQKKQSRRKQRKDTEDPQFSSPIEHVPDDTENVASVPTHSNDPLLNGEDRLKKNELMELCTSLSQRVLDLENSKTSQAAEITELKRRVKKMEGKRKLKPLGMKRLFKIGRYAQVVSSKDEDVTLVDETQGRNDEEMFDTGILDGEEVFAEQDVVEKEVSIVEVTTDNVELEEEEKLARQRKEDANIAKWDNVQAIMDADYELAARLQAEEQGELTIEEKSRFFKQKLDENVEAKVEDEAEMEKHMEIVPDDELEIDAIPLATKPLIIVDWKIIKEGKMGYFQIIRVDGSSKRYSSMIKMLHILTEDTWKLSRTSKYPIVDWETQILANDKYYYQIKRSVGSVKHYRIFRIMIYDFDRQDVMELYRLVKERFQTASPEEVMEFESAQSNTTAKLPILKLENGTSVTKIQYSDAKTMFAAIETCFGGNEATKKTQKTLLKQQYENFSASSTESLDSIFNKLKKIVSRLSILGVVITQEDLNSNFLISLPPEWNTHVIVWINKVDIEIISFDDLYNNFKIVEQDVKKYLGTSSGAQNLAFMTAPSTSSTNDVNTANPAYEVSTVSPNINTACPQVSTANFSDNTMYAFMVKNPNGSNLLQHDLEQIHEDDLKVMDLKWQLSLLSMRAKECFNCHKMGHFARECRAPRNKEGQFKYQDNTRKQGNNEDTSSKAMLAIDGVGFDWSDMAEEGLATVEEQLITYRKNEVLFSEEVAVLKREVACKDYEINVLKSEFEKVKQEKEGIEFKIEKFDKASKGLDKLLGSQITNKSKKGLGYNVVPPPHPLIYNRPKKLDLSYSGLDEFKDLEFKSYGSEDSKQESNIVCDKKSDDSTENSNDSFVKEQVSEDTSSFVESSLNVDKETVFLVDKKLEFSKSKNHETLVKRSVRVNYNYTTNKTHPNAQRNMVPRAVLMKTGLKPFNTAKPKAINIARPKAVNTAMQHSAVVNAISGCSRHMTRDIAYLLDFKEFDRGYVTFGGGAHGGRISDKGTLKTGSLNFEDVYFVNELNFNLFSVSQMCDKKNYVLFTDTKCLILSRNFKLPNESQILLKIPRKDNMYSFDMKNIVPKESLTCLVTKATSYESILWHRRLGHINFKNINKLVKDNLIRGLPTKCFENDQTCVACLKGKQHRSSCKSKVLNPITKPLFMLHMDLFGPTFVSSLMHKKYCLVVTDDYSRFT